jgi:hypothetical protein
LTRRQSGNIKIFAKALKNLLRHLFLFLGCLHLIGGPYAILQVYAWTNMLVSYSQEGSLKQAVTDTFSGEKPCHLCKKIAKAKSTESSGKKQHAPLPPPASKLFNDLFPPTIASLSAPYSSPFPQPVFLTGEELLSLSASGPPVPPPRC